MNKPSNVVLLIDDEPKIRRFLRAGFELQGYSVIEAENAADVVREAESEEAAETETDSIPAIEDAIENVPDVDEVSELEASDFEQDQAAEEDDA